MFSYTVSFDNAHQHLIHVELSSQIALDKEQEFWLPNWIPGSYMLRDFSKNIVTITAKDRERPIELVKLANNRWKLSESTEELHLAYDVYAWDLSVRSAHFDQNHCFFNGTSTFVAVTGKEDNLHNVEIIKPKNQTENYWQVATSMKNIETDSNGFGNYQSSDYAELIDHPFELADYSEVKFTVLNVEHRMIFTEAPKGVDYVRVASDVSKICEHECEFFGDISPPFSQYLFMTFVQKSGFGGLEHRSSTALHCGHSDLPMIGDDLKKKSKGYQTFLSLCCHEYFHSWNVKRIIPACFSSYLLQTEVNTELLWFFEGITSYYDELFLVRSGVITTEQYLDMIAKNITRYLKGTGRNKQTITESSYDAWTKFYKQDENAPNAIVSYYVKGGLVAFCLDFEIRKLTDGDQSLDDLLRRIWKKFGKTGIGVGEKDIQREAEKLVGESMDKFFGHVLYSTEELDLQGLFDQLGITYRLSSPIGQAEKGGFKKNLTSRNDVNSLGITHRSEVGGTEIISVFEGSCAETAGLSNKDIIIAVDGIRVTSSEIDACIAKYPKGSLVEISYFRRDKLCQSAVTLYPANKYLCELSLDNEKINPTLSDWLFTTDSSNRL